MKHSDRAPRLLEGGESGADSLLTLLLAFSHEAP